jgi:hypothetical protein
MSHLHGFTALRSTQQPPWPVFLGDHIVDEGTAEADEIGHPKLRWGGGVGVAFLVVHARSRLHDRDGDRRRIAKHASTAASQPTHHVPLSL